LLQDMRGDSYAPKVRNLDLTWGWGDRNALIGRSILKSIFWDGTIAFLRRSLVGS
jgi:hypothetical protein